MITPIVGIISRYNFFNLYFAESEKRNKKQRLILNCVFYYVTVCTYGRECLFGEIVDKKMVLNQCGDIVDKTLRILPKKYNVELDTYQIMPNHLHFILIINLNNNVHLGNVVGYFKYQSTKQINNVGVGYSDPCNIRIEQDVLNGREDPALQKII